MNSSPTAHYFNAYIKNLHKPPILREAIAQRHSWAQIPIAINPADLIPGTKPDTSMEIANFIYASGTYVADGLLDDYAATLPEAEKPTFWANIEIMRKNHPLHLLWYNYDSTCKALDFTHEEYRGLITGAAGSTFFCCHMVIDYEGILGGLNRYADEIEKYNKSGQNPAFYQAMREILAAFQAYITRTGKACLDAAIKAQDQHVKSRLTQHYHDLTHIAINPPKNFRQATKLAWLSHCLAGADTFGRFDQYLYPFYRHDIDSGEITKEEAYTYILNLMDKIEEASEIQNMTIGGLTPTGDPAYNDLTEMLLKATAQAGYKGPNLCFRINEKMPNYWWDEVTACLSAGTGLPALYNDEVMIAWLTRAGVELEDARNYCLAGCSQIMVPGKAQFANDIGMMNIAKILELTLYNGADKAVTGEITEMRTGETFETFDKLIEAFCKQLTYYAKLEADTNNKIVAAIGKYEGYALRTLFTQNCLEKGLSCFSGGAVYNHVQLECIGITNAADSLAAIKQLVYEENKITLPELREALLADFEGNEPLRQLCLNAPKFGNDDPIADDIRIKITQHLFSELRAQPSTIGGHYIPGEVIFTAHAPSGEGTGATPDGRKKGQVLADSAGSMQGTDIKGPTALIKSVLKIPADEICTTIAFNIKFLRQSFEKDIEKIKYLFKTFIESGGQQMQINVLDPATLKKALEDPENHKNLVVRVGGFSAYFHTLPRNLQEEIALRSGY